MVIIRHKDHFEVRCNRVVVCHQDRREAIRIMQDVLTREALHEKQEIKK